MKITSKGQITIPQAIRERGNLLPGTEVEFSIRGEEVVISRKQSDRDKFDTWIEEFAGSGTSGLSADVIMEMTRGED